MSLSLQQRLMMRKLKAEKEALANNRPEASEPKKPTPPAPPRIKQAAAEVAAVLENIEGEVDGIDKSQVTLDHLNEKQLQGVRLGVEGVSYCLNGAAGAGKTTTTKLTMEELVKSDRLGTISESDFNEYSGYVNEGVLTKGGYRAAVVSYTNVAVRNIRSILPDGIQQHCSTAHKLLGYAPVEVEVPVLDAQGNETGEYRDTMRFEPTFGVEPKTDGGRGVGAGMKLPHLDLLVIEEAGSMPVWLYKTLLAALPNPERTQIIFLGDINQLPPAIGDGILGYKQLELPTVSLDKTYRNVGLVTRFAHRILTGKPLSLPEETKWNIADESGEIKLAPFPTAMSAENACLAYGNRFRQMVVEGKFTEDNSVVLIPFNVKFGTIEMNKWIAQGISERDNLPVYEVIAGYDHHYLCVGDRVMHNKQFYRIAEINRDPYYIGSKCRPASIFVDRWGRVRKPKTPEEEIIYEQQKLELTSGQQASGGDIDMLLSQTADSLDERRKSSSHKIVLELIDNPSDKPVKITISSAGDVNGMIMTYALTVYKSQGSEWENVYLILHQSHAVSLCREQLYTGATRARRNLTILYSNYKTTGSTSKCSMYKCFSKAEITGNTMEEKLNYFRKKLNVDGRKAELEALKRKYKYSADGNTEDSSTESESESTNSTN